MLLQLFFVNWTLQLCDYFTQKVLSNQTFYPLRHGSLPDNSGRIFVTYKPNVSINSWDIPLHYHIRFFHTRTHIAIFWGIITIKILRIVRILLVITSIKLHVSNVDKEFWFQYELEWCLNFQKKIFSLYHRLEL